MSSPDMRKGRISGKILEHGPKDYGIEPGVVWHRFELMAAATGLVVLLPLLIAVAFAIKLSDGGPVLYCHRRIGRHFRPFFVYKFRTMVAGADRQGGAITGAQDPRVTRVGRILRRYKLDELPQLLNVLRGEMALVGPRPEVAEYVERFPVEYRLLMSARPGITDPATLAFANEEELLSGANFEKIYGDEILPRKLAISLSYFSNRTWRSDLGVVLRTLRRILSTSEAKTAASSASSLVAKASQR